MQIIIHIVIIKMYLKKIKILIVVAGIIFGMFLGGGIVDAVYSCPVINGVQLDSCGPNGPCVNDTSLCPNTTTAPPPGSSGSPASVGTSCTGDIIYDVEAVRRCNALAVTQGQALGYDISCDVGARNEFITMNDGTLVPGSAGIRPAYYPSCTVNGDSGHEPQGLVGYVGTGPGFTRPGEFLGTINYGNRFFGSNYITRNPGWGTFSTELARTGASGGSAGCGRTATCGLPGGGSRNPSFSGGGSSGSSSSITTTDSWYYRDPYVSDSEDASLPNTPAGCTGYESTTECHPEWNRPGSLCNAGNMTGPCRPERVNPYAAAGLARKAETLAKQRGFTTACSARYTPFRPNIDPDTGLNFYYTIECTLNGGAPMSADSIVSGTANFPVLVSGGAPIGFPINLTPSCGLTATCAAR